MSKLIDALNRVQSLKDEDPVVISNSSDPISSTVSPPTSSPVNSSRVISKQLSTQNSADVEKPLFNMAANDWLGVLQQEYLKNFVREGGGAIKVAVFHDQDSLQGCQQDLDGLANSEGYVFVKVDARFTKVHMVERLSTRLPSKWIGTI